MKYLLMIFILCFAISCEDESNSVIIDSNMPEGNTDYYVRIQSLIPNPAGTDSGKESFMLKNYANRECDLTGWYVEDLASKRCELDSVGILGANASYNYIILNVTMLNNASETVYLKTKDDIIVQTVTYKNAGVDEVISTEPETEE
ncbi:MAG: hypothetical protein PF588_08790 [Candidatus Kapabacteria bacterium]|jgi:hypothetical protein|nr:hypothetical protein [Candidatus Kapabacteria bacterium]